MPALQAIPLGLSCAQGSVGKTCSPDFECGLASYWVCQPPFSTRLKRTCSPFTKPPKVPLWMTPTW